MRRREFITLVGGATIWPFASHAQQSSQVWRLGYVGTGGIGDQLLQAFTQKLEALGHLQGKSVVVSRVNVLPEAKTIELAITRLLPDSDILVIWGTLGGTFESCPPILRMSVHRASPEVAVVRPNRRE